MKTVILEKLKEIEQKENVKIIMAIESGSRAWGFESPDSDYDVRFIYVRDIKDYLKLDYQRDVIEWQLDDTLDINGWDIKKALQLLYKSNPTLHEWCYSPIIYHETPEFLKLKELLQHYFHKKKLIYHYLHMADSNYREYLKGDKVKSKKYLYVLRSLLACKWIIHNNTIPPIVFTELMESELDDNLKPIVKDLLEKKKSLPEIGLVDKIQELNDYIETNLISIKDSINNVEDDISNYDLLNEFFLSIII